MSDNAVTRELDTWRFGARDEWTLRAVRTEGGDVHILASRMTLTRGSRHGRYVVLPGGEVLTVSMADARVNEHLQGARMRARLAALLDEGTA